MRGSARQDGARHPAFRRACALALVAVLVAVGLVFPTWCAVSGLWW